MGGQRLNGTDVACWLLKTSTAPADLVAGWAPGAPQRLRRCLHRSYRLGLVRPGQRCLLWRSGPASPGVHAVGLVAAAPGEDLAVEVDLRLLAAPLPRAELLTTPFAGAEVVRMPAGSNPSPLTAEQLAPVLERLDDDALDAAGWA